ncbi:hypothetical protein O6H91_01G020400 [Diphasiastrum complanatum]|uniref:Uncharacterized protein n=1 Tax=Diphasiastrum complanatum TaxID=34168 RepID=A0ACC2ENR5_DIPCM|nr:hypothetical protein O6H91_01G020400 [Diphasiastrum complanatum]
MNDDMGLAAGNSRGSGRASGSLKSSWGTISNYWRSISANATRVASAVRSVGSSYASQSSGIEEEQQREQVLWAGFEKLELGPTDVRHVLLLTYLNGFQVWDVESAKNVRELVSRRDGPVSYLRLQPQPCAQESHEGNFKAARPLLLVISGEASSNVSSIPGGYSVGHLGSDGTHSGGFANSLPTVIRFCSLRTLQYVHTLRFKAGIFGVRCSPRIVAVAFVSQIYCYDATTLQSILSVLTYPNLPMGPGGGSYGYGALAVGPRWLAYAANHPLVSCTGRASPHHLTPSPGSPGSGSPRPKSNSGSVLDPENAGIVIVRDFVSKAVVAQIRAHTSPISALCFDQSGTLLVTASVYGHNLNVFLLMPQSPANANMSAAYDSTGSFVHLYKLYRGFTNAVIQDIGFSSDSHWICVSTSRGTSHIFAISPFGGSVGHHTHGSMPVNGVVRSKVAPLPVVPWWSSNGPVKVAQQVLSPPTLVLSVVNRIKNGPAGWLGTVSGAAAAATGKTSSSGAVAAVFHDGGDYDSEFQCSPDPLNDKLWVLCPSGHLARYLLRPSIGEQLGLNNSNIAEVVSVGFDSYQGHEFGLHVEPLEKWDVCRRSNWNEREERIHSFVSESVDSDELNKTFSGRMNNHCSSESRGGKGDATKTEDKQHWYMSKAEIQMQQARAYPIWAKPNIFFEVVLLDCKKDLCSYLGPCDGGEVEIEKVPSRVVELRRKDLTPVIERFKNQDFRELGTENFSAFSNSTSSQPRDDVLHNGPIRRHTAGMQPIKKISLGQEVDSVPGNNFYMNGFQSDRDGFHAETQPTSYMTGSQLAHQQYFSIPELDEYSPPLRALDSISKYGIQSATLTGGDQKHNKENAKMLEIYSQIHSGPEAENTSTTTTDMDNFSPDNCITLDHLAHGFAAAMVVNEPKETYFQVREDDSNEDVKTVNADVKTIDADCSSVLPNVWRDARFVQDNFRTVTIETHQPTFGDVDGHFVAQIDGQDTLSKQNSWRIKEYKKDSSVVHCNDVTASPNEANQGPEYHVQAESTEDINQKGPGGRNKLKHIDNLKDADGSDSYIQRDESLGESGGEIWDGAMFPFNEDGT